MSRRPNRSLRLLVAAFGDAGHAFPAIALGRALAARGHAVVIETWEQWRSVVEAQGLEFRAAEEYEVFPPPDPDSADAVPPAHAAARELLPLLEELRPDAVVSDILTLAPTLAANVAGLPHATLIPHVYPVSEPGRPFFGFGAMPPRTALGRGVWSAAAPILNAGLRRGRTELNVARDRLGLEPLERFHGGISPDLALVATLPQLEYPRAWPASVHVTGPMTFEIPHEEVDLPPGDEPLVVVAPSTAQDPECKLVRIALEALADEPVRVLATTNRHVPSKPLPPTPANARLVEWVSYSQVMPAADLVIQHGGHGTICRALAAGTPTLCCSFAGDMAENGTRVAWSGAGLALPWPLVGRRTMRATVRTILGEPRFRRSAQEVAAWCEGHDGSVRGAELVERLARARSST